MQLSSPLGTPPNPNSQTHTDIKKDQIRKCLSSLSPCIYLCEPASFRQLVNLHNYPPRTITDFLSYNVKVPQKYKIIVSKITKKEYVPTLMLLLCIKFPMTLLSSILYTCCPLLSFEALIFSKEK